MAAVTILAVGRPIMAFVPRLIAPETLASLPSMPFIARLAALGALASLDLAGIPIRGPIVAFVAGLATPGALASLPIVVFDRLRLWPL